MDRALRRWVLCLISSIACALFSSQASAQTLSDPVAPQEVLAVVPGDTLTGMFEHLIYVPGPEAPCPPGPSQKMDKPWVEERTWGCLRLKNTGDTRGIWRIDFEGSMSEGYTFWLVQGKEETQILTAPVNRTMAQLETGGPWLASMPLAILPGETVEVWVLLNTGAWFGDLVPQRLPKLVPEDVFDRVLDRRIFILGAQLAACVLLIGFFLSFSALLRSTPARRYALYFTSATVTLIGYYGLFAYFFPSYPVLQVLAVNRLFEIVMIILHLRFIVSFVRESIGSHRILRLSPWLIWSIPISFILISVLLGTSRFLFDSSESGSLVRVLSDWLWTTGQFLYPITVVIVWSVLSVWSSVLLVRRGTDGAWFFAAGAFLVIITPFLALLMQFLSADNIFTVIYFASSLGMIDALIFAAAIVRLTFGLRSQRDLALQEALTVSQEKLQLSQSLLAARENLDTARDLAEQHRSRLALTGHDLRQPLLSLRLALDKENAVSSTLRESLSTSLSYLKTVLDQILADTRPDTEASPAVVKPEAHSEPIPLQVILQNAVRMFHGEASAKDLSLRIVQTSAVVATEPVALIRIVSNLVSNAVKYTETGRVLVGVRRRDGAFAIEVHDTGPGLTETQIIEIQQSYHRGETSKRTEGEGIGLASVQLLGAQNNLSLTIRSRPGAGSCFAIEGLTPMDVQPD